MLKFNIVIIYKYRLIKIVLLFGLEIKRVFIPREPFQEY